MIDRFYFTPGIRIPANKSCSCRNAPFKKIADWKDFSDSSQYKADSRQVAFDIHLFPAHRMHSSKQLRACDGLGTRDELAGRWLLGERSPRCDPAGCAGGCAIGGGGGSGGGVRR